MDWEMERMGGIVQGRSRWEEYWRDREIGGQEIGIGGRKGEH